MYELNGRSDFYYTATAASVHCMRPPLSFDTFRDQGLSLDQWNENTHQSCFVSGMLLSLFDFFSFFSPSPASTWSLLRFRLKVAKSMAPRSIKS
jgi:hypothetical protein